MADWRVAVAASRTPGARSSWAADGQRNAPEATRTCSKFRIMKFLALSVSAAAVGAFSVQKSSQLTSRRPVVPPCRAPTALSSTRRDPITGKIYVGEPEPLEELADLVGGLLGGLGRVADGLLGPAPVPIPVPVEDEREVPDNGQTPPRDPYKYPGTY